MDSTFAVEFLPNDANCPVFVNADLIAAGLSPFPSESGRRPGRQADVAADRRTRAQRGQLRLRDHVEWPRLRAPDPPRQALGYRVKLFFLGLPTPVMAIARVAHRVEGGGHDVPKPVIDRRFSKGWRNFENVYRDLVDDWKLYDNAGSTPVLLAEGGRG